MSFGKDPDGNLEVIDINNYYAFGMNHIGGTKSLLGGYRNYKYNGKELQETGMYDFGARMYMADIGRWGVIDPLAEMGRRTSAYNYTLNNPIRFIDPDGMWSYDINGNASTRDADEIASFMSELRSKQDDNKKQPTPKQEKYRKGDYVAVVNAPKGAGGFGHNALLIGNDNTGWQFIAKEGRDEDENSNSGNNPLTGGPALDARTAKFKSLDDFFSNNKFSEYKEGVVMKIQSSTAKEVKR